MTYKTRFGLMIGTTLIATSLMFGCVKNKPESETMVKALATSETVAPKLIATLKLGESVDVRSGPEKAKLSFLKVLKKGQDTFAVVRAKACLEPINIIVHVGGKPMTGFVPGNHSLIASRDSAGNVSVAVFRPE